jgi:hypothetical protein
MVVAEVEVLPLLNSWQNYFSQEKELKIKLKSFPKLKEWVVAVSLEKDIPKKRLSLIFQ